MPSLAAHPHLFLFSSGIGYPPHSRSGQRPAPSFDYRPSPIIDCCVTALYEASAPAISCLYWPSISWQVLSCPSQPFPLPVKVFERVPESSSLSLPHRHSQNIARCLWTLGFCSAQPKMVRAWCELKGSGRLFRLL